MKIIELDGSKCDGPRGVYERIGEAMDFGQYFGKNPDALLDFLIPLEEALLIIFKNSRAFSDRHPDEFERLLNTFRHIENHQRNRDEKFHYRLE